MIFPVVGNPPKWQFFETDLLQTIANDVNNYLL